MRTIITAWLLMLPTAAFAHAGHWHLDEETLEKIFGAADAVYQWFVGNAVVIATVTLVVLTVWGIVWWRQQGKAE
ncbi:hypothetical protein MIT9_P2500 [Methylomarinovum caldicuralii]|uniref:Uncharacterized protein n=1 Tax=Methylomarinovum caldicuralii TaxID=438856 RepID=A0AAU9CE35_9GAMM|nr:hypothetical protein [Methylomarinovum caldicuralii]BCX82909.1 hypothetical protein MIT9_P2500 [Methylomarinovum caldicuralii]